MDPQVPAVVAVVVTTDPGPWFEEALSSLAAQDYGELSVLVLSSGDDAAGVTDLVGRILPDAFVRHLPGHPGYAAATNEALGMVEGAAFYLLCHDDVALDPDAVHQLVEESFRSNAGVVSPKFVNWDDRGLLLHVGMGCDKTGAVVDRIVPGEVDHGQHDAVRDVFVAPGGCTLVRADLFAELEGLDGGIVAMGEDLDLSWRCQVAGSRVVVAPGARVRHREVVASGLEPLAVGAESTGKHPVTMQALQRRHELRAVFKCYTPIHLVRVLPQAALLAFGEVVVAILARDRDRVRAVVGAWRWNARRLRELRPLRREVAEHRLFPDAEVRRLQMRGSARLSRYLSRLSHQGLEAANAVAVSRGGSEDERVDVAVLTGSVGAAFSEDADFDELDDLGRRAGRDRFGRKIRPVPLSTGRQRALAVFVAFVVIAVGTRELFFGSLPIVGQLAPLPSWSTSWHHFFSGWQSAGVGTTAPASPAFGIFGITGTVLFGAMGTLQRVLLLGCIPVGAWGTARFMRPFGSPRARTIAVVCYLGLPLPYGALGTGRWDGLVAYAAFPFLALRLARAADVEPFVTLPGAGLAEPSGRPDRRPRCHRRGRGEPGAGDRPGLRAHRARLGRRRTGRGRARPRLAARAGGARVDRRGGAPRRTVGGGHGPGRPGVHLRLRPAPGGCDRPGMGRTGAFRGRAGRPVAHRVAARRRRGAPARPRPRRPARVGGAAVGRRTGLVGPRPRGGPRGHGVLCAVADRRADACGARRRRRHRPRHLLLGERPGRA